MIILGLRRDVIANFDPNAIRLPRMGKQVTVEEAIGDLPVLRSGLSRGEDNFLRWKEAVAGAFWPAAGKLPDALKWQNASALIKLHGLHLLDAGWVDAVKVS